MASVLILVSLAFESMSKNPLPWARLKPPGSPNNTCPGIPQVHIHAFSKEELGKPLFYFSSFV